MKRTLSLFLIIGIAFAFDVDYELKRGWNLLALPSLTDSTEIESIFPIVPPGYLYDPETMAYSPIEGLPEINEGFWILVSADTNISIPAISPWPVDTPDTPDVPEPPPVPEGGCGMIFGKDFGRDVGVVDNGHHKVIVTTVPDTIAAGGEDYLAILSVDGELEPGFARMYGVKPPFSTSSASMGGGCVAMGISGDADLNITIFSVDSTGDPIWVNSFPPPSAGFNFSMTTLSDGSVVAMTGPYFLKFSSDGTFLWSKRINMNMKSAKPGIGGGFVVLGSGGSFPEGDVPIIAKLDGDGDLISATALSTSTTDNYTTFDVGDDGSIIAAGVTFETAIPTGRILKLSSSLDIVWAKDIEPSEAADAMDFTFKHIQRDSTGIIGMVGDMSGDVFAMFFEPDGDLIITQAFIGEYLGLNDFERASWIGMNDDRFHIFGWKNNWDIQSRIISIETRPDQPACTSWELDFSDSDATIDLEDITLETESADLDVTTDSIESGAITVHSFFFCREILDD